MRNNQEFISAFRLALSHGHWWTWATGSSWFETLLDAFFLGGWDAVRSVCAEAHRADNMQDTVGVIAKPLHTTQSGRTSWCCKGELVEVTIQRPDGICLEAVLDSSGQFKSVKRGSVPACHRHYTALAYCVGALRERYVDASEVFAAAPKATQGRCLDIPNYGISNESATCRNTRARVVPRAPILPYSRTQFFAFVDHPITHITLCESIAPSGNKCFKPYTQSEVKALGRFAPTTLNMHDKCKLKRAVA